MKPPYKTKQNAWYTQALFWERWVNMVTELRQDFDPPFTLYHEKPGYISGRKTFVELQDPTGYKWAMKYLGDYDHWKQLLKSKWFQDALEVWQDELRMKMRSEALDTIRKIAKDGAPAQALVASKYLASFEWDKGARGRPSKAELTGELKRAAETLKVEDADAERIGLRLVK